MSRLLLLLLLPTAALAVDADGDGFDAAIDCDDLDASVNPGAVEVPADGIDSDCDAAELCYADRDLDGYGSPVLVPSTRLDCADPGRSPRADDCNDQDPNVNPGVAFDLPGNGIDDDCDGLIDGGAPPPLRADAVSRACPATGDAVVTWGSATPSGPVAVLLGAPGTAVVPAGPCRGALVSVVPRASTVFLDASNVRGNGLHWLPAMPAPLCTLEVQVLDLTTCAVSPALAWR